MEESKARVGIREWGITQTSLEEVGSWPSAADRLLAVVTSCVPTFGKLSTGSATRVLLPTPISTHALTAGHALLVVAGTCMPICDTWGISVYVPQVFVKVVERAEAASDALDASSGSPSRGPSPAYSSPSGTVGYQAADAKRHGAGGLPPV